MTVANEANEKQKKGEIETRTGERATAACRLKGTRSEQICVDGVVVGTFKGLIFRTIVLTITALKTNSTGVATRSLPTLNSPSPKTAAGCSRVSPNRECSGDRFPEFAPVLRENDDRTAQLP